uniref:phytoene desaturase family protein n=1 Tax=Rhodosalinus sp. TaxID=2047741 RepID=UPI0035664BCC
LPASDCFATAFPDGKWLGVSTDPALTAARIRGESAADAARWHEMLDEFAADAPHVFSVLGSPMTPGALVRTAFRIWRKRDSAFLLKLARLMLTSPRAFLEENFESPRVQAMCAAWGMHLDFPPDQGGGAVFPYLEAMASQSFGMVIGKGGADTVTRALRAMIEARGGRIETGAEVTEILLESGVASGVRLADGRVARAGGAVIANLAPRGLMRLLPRGSGSERYDRQMARFRHAPGTMMVHLALDGLPDWAAGAELKRFMYVHLAPSLQQMAETYTQAVNGLLPREPVLVVAQPGTVDPSRAPEGKHTLWVQVRMVPGTITGDAAGEIGATDWESAKAPMAERVLDILETYAPGLRGRILGQCVMSPADLEAGNPNLVGGDQIAGSHHPYQNFVFRPVPGRADWSTPVPKLHMVGASTWPGGGTGAGSGTMLAEKLAGA